VIVNAAIVRPAGFSSADQTPRNMSNEPDTPKCHNSFDIAHTISFIDTDINSFWGAWGMAREIFNKGYRSRGVSLLALTVWALAAPAHAQSAKAGDGALEEIVVTAQKRTEKLINVPISITAISADQLVERGAKNVRDLASGVPNFTSYSSDDGDPTFLVRGLSSSARSIGFEGGLGAYIDGVYTGRTGSVTQDLDDVERVEVLRGPQGTLFGKNTTIGAISISTRRPGNEFTGSASAEYGNYNHYRVALGISGPLVRDRVAGKISGYVDSTDGYVKNIFPGGVPNLNGEKSYGVRGELRFTPSESLDIALRGDYARSKRNTFEDEAVALTQNAFGLPNALIDPVVPGANTVNIDGRNSSVRKLYGGSVAINYTLPSDHILTYIAAYRKYDGKLENTDADNTRFQYLLLDYFDKNEQITQELRVASPDSGRLKYVAGLYYFNQKSTSNRNTSVGVDALNILVGGFNFPAALFADPAIRTNVRVKTESYAAFANASYEIFDNLTLLAGLRYTNETKDLQLAQTSPAFFATPGILGPLPAYLNVAPTTDKRSESDFSPTAGLSYKFSNGVTAYVKYSKGFKSGGWNAELVSPTRVPVAPDVSFFDVTQVRFKSESITSYEAGLKTELFDKRLRINAALFQLDYTDIQQQRFIGGLRGYSTDNAGRARVRGFELELNARPVNGLDLSATVGYADAKYVRYVITPAIADPDGSGPLTGSPEENQDGFALDAPKWTAAFAAQYAIPVSDQLTLTFRNDVSYRSQRLGTGNLTERSLTTVPSFVTVDGRISLASKGGWDVALWGKNLTDNLYAIERRPNTNLAFLGVAQQTTSYGQPRSYGVRLGYKF
jgi:iron complex outermembrane recepter protein